MMRSGASFQRTAGFIIVGGVLLMAIFAPFLAPHDPNASSIMVLSAPTAEHPFGTDDLGRDVLSRVIYGARVSLVIGIAATIVGMLLGVPIGLTAGYRRGRFDMITVQFIDIFIALPPIVMATGASNRCAR